MNDGQDMLRMQAEAKKRVMEMRDRSRFFLQDMQNGARPPRPAPTDNRGEHDKGTPPPPPGFSEPPKKEHEDETDRLLLLSLILLLQSENADKHLLLALLYIVGAGI
ncbi:MAG: hypothetical protein IK104_11620 [Clostridia bacterium]|nr:hypothetical protein [Clostridia bacterium]